jgi:hypothetical protein
VFLAAVRDGPPDVPRLDILQQTRARETMRTFRYVMSGCVIASLFGDAKAPERGLEVLAELGDPVAAGFFGPEIYRVEGELRRRLAPRAVDEAARCFQRGCELARRYELKSLELRAATSLARLWRDTGRRHDARQALADVYAWFTEGFDTQDLRTAKALLDELG